MAASSVVATAIRPSRLIVQTLRQSPATVREIWDAVCKDMARSGTAETHAPAGDFTERHPVDVNAAPVVKSKTHLKTILRDLEARKVVKTVRNVDDGKQGFRYVRTVAIPFFWRIKRSVALSTFFFIYTHMLVYRMCFVNVSWTLILYASPQVYVTSQLCTCGCPQKRTNANRHGCKGSINNYVT